MSKSWQLMYEDAIRARRDDKARIAALEAALLEYWDAKDWGAIGAADSTAAKLLPADMKKRATSETNVKPHVYDNHCLCPKCNAAKTGAKHGDV